MDVEMVGDQHDALGLGEVLIDQGAQGVGDLDGGARSVTVTWRQPR